MRLKVIALAVLCLVCVISSEAQNKIQIIESKTEALFSNNRLSIRLAIKSPQAFDSANIFLKILDSDNTVLAQKISEKNIKRGTQIVKIPVDLYVAKKNSDDILWHRLQYEIVSKDRTILAKGVISLSEIMPEIFDLKVITSEQIFAGMKYRVHVLTLHPFTKKPIKNVKINGKLLIDLDVDTDDDELNLEAIGKSNSEGFTSLDFVIPSDKKIDDDAELTIKAEKNGIKNEVEEYLDVPNKSFFYMHSDKPIYQPNQNLYVRGILLNPLKKPIKDTEFEIEILDEEDEVVHSETVKTSRFGVAHFKWQIPKNIKLGKYKIKLEDDYDGEFGELGIKITRYDLPNFAVEAKPDKTFYLPKAKKAVINVSANYLFGKPVTKGKVRIVREEDSKNKVERIEKEAKEVDEKGNFSAEFDLKDIHKILENQNWRRFNDLKFVAYFTDLTTNRTEQKRFDLRITKDPIHVYFIRHSSSANPSLPYQFYVSTFYADGTPAKCDVEVEGNYRNVQFTEKLAESKTNSYGASKFEISIPQKPFPDAKDEFNLKITAQDNKGNVGNLAENLYVDKDKKQIRIHSDKTIYKPNETIYTEIFSTEENDTIVVDVVDKSGVIYSKRVKISKGQGKLRLYYRPDFKGELTLSTYSINDLDRYEFPHHSKTIIFPESNQLDFNVKSLKTVYRPNEEAEINFKVRDKKGKALETALGVVVLDKAIEERAATENTPDNYAVIRKLLGIGGSFGNLKRRDLDNLDLEKRISGDLQLAAEYLLVNKSYNLRGFSSESFQGDAREVFEDYFKRELEPIKKILITNYDKTGEFPTDKNFLKKVLAKNEIDFDSLKDAWGMPYKFEFIPQRRDMLLKIITSSADKKFDTEDDFVAGRIKFERYRKLNNQLNIILNNHIQETKNPPKTKEELKTIWKKGGYDFEKLRDDWNRQFYIDTKEYERNAQKLTYENIGNLDGKQQQAEKLSVVRQKVVVFRIRSKGKDGVQSRYDDFDVGIFSVVLAEEIVSKNKAQSKILKHKTSNSSGAISGTIVDATGAVIPGATITVKNQNAGETFDGETNENGYFLIPNLPSGIYRVSVSFPGFMTRTVQNIVVSSMNRIELNLYLMVAGVTAMVDVSSGVSAVLDTTDTKVSTNIRSNSKSIVNLIGTNDQKFTPRVREYFPETLLWKPEIITSKNGRAEIKFKLADSLTTWKLYAIGSTQDGQVEMFEKELQTFQPFFAELDPPKILTEGDEISLPVPIRNYTKKTQNVAVQMAENNWSSLLNGSTQQIKIDADSTTNAIFKFRATTPTENGKQKVTAFAKKEGDAIEKPVIVKPNGREEIDSQTKLFERETFFYVNFPAEAFAKTRRAEIKIYPNMLSHIAESVEGLLKRPYGCGEQTTSSTYPNLMILKFTKESGNGINPNLKRTAEGYLQDGYKRLLNYQTHTGFGYWNGNSPDIALTAYVLQFLNDAKDFIKVDKSVIEKAEKWLISQQNADGSWANRYSKSSITTAYVARTLSNSNLDNQAKKEVLQKAILHLKNKIPETKDSYTLANLALASVNIKDFDTANKAIGKLLTENSLPVNANRTAFYGWGAPAKIETNAILIQALLLNEERDENLISKGLQYLLQNKDKYGVWYSTQTTVNVLNTLILFQNLQKDTTQDNQNKAEIYINSAKVNELQISKKALQKPIVLDVSEPLNQNNRIEIKGLKGLAMAQVVATHYINWNQVKEDFSYFDLKVDYSRKNVEISEEITCNVELKRNRGDYGMILAEIGIPPGADVDRETLDQIVRKKKISRYDVLPDKVIVYAWADYSEKIFFAFKFKPRYGINAQTPASFVYDYYNEEAKAIVAPLRFEVE